MNIYTISNLLQNSLSNLQVNMYTNGKSGTLQIAEDYLNSLDNCTFKRAESKILEMYYKGKSFGSIKGQSPSTNNGSAIRTANNKIETENILKEKNIRTTESRVFEENDYHEAKELIKFSLKPMVLKPYNLNGGRGITLNVNDTKFDFAWKQAVGAYIDKGKEFKVMIQPMIEGFEIRMLVIENKFNSAILRVPANIIGDGKSTVNELIENKNRLRIRNPHLKRLLITIDDRVNFNLEQQLLNIHSIPAKNQFVFLHRTSNVSQGGDNYEVSHLVSNNIIQIAEAAVSAISGLHTAGVDLIVNSFEDIEPLVLELNPGANLRML